jgi:mycothiol synthase
VLHRSTDPTQLVWAPLCRADLDELDALLTTIEDADELGDRHTVTDLYRTFEASEVNAAEHCLVGRHRSGELVAYGWNHPFADDTDPRRVHVSGGVHPDHRRRGAGHELLRWQLDAARRWHARTRTEQCGPLRAIAYVEEDRIEQRALYEDLGLRPLRWYADLTLKFDRPLPPQQDPPGIRIVPLNRKRFEAVRAAHNEAFADHWGSRPIDAAGWEKQLVRPESRLSWSWVALEAETSEVVGYATNAAYEDDWAEQGFSEGWTDRLGVRPAWRGRGVAQALLAASLRSFAEAGLAGAGLGVDSDLQGRAFQLYKDLGYQAAHTVVMYAVDEVDAPAET